jgi:hypothetical protein
MASTIQKFLDSYSKFKEFLMKWSIPLDKRCVGNTDEQIEASYYVWSRYSISIHTLRRLCEPHFFPDLCVIARCCLEYDASLLAVMSDKNLAKNYLEFEKHAKANYLRKFGNSIDKNKKTLYENILASQGVEDIENYKWDKWCAKQGGHTGLIKKYESEDALKLYSFWSHLAHGSVMGIRILQNTPDIAAELLAKLVDVTYSGYLCVTKSFLDKTLGLIITQDSENCKKEFNEVTRLFV